MICKLWLADKYQFCLIFWAMLSYHHAYVCLDESSHAPCPILELTIFCCGHISCSMILSIYIKLDISFHVYQISAFNTVNATTTFMTINSHNLIIIKLFNITTFETYMYLKWETFNGCSIFCIFCKCHDFAIICFEWLRNKCICYYSIQGMI